MEDMNDLVRALGSDWADWYFDEPDPWVQGAACGCGHESCRYVIVEQP